MEYNFQDITTPEAAFAVQGLDIFKTPDFSNYTANMREHLVHEWRCLVCIAAVNGDFVPDWKNPDQIRYMILSWVVRDDSKPSGFGLSYYDFDNSYTCTFVGARLVFGSTEKRAHFRKYFWEVWEAYYLS